MSEEIKSLLEKIRSEGVEAGEKKAQEIELEAKKEAQAILQKAGSDAEKLIAEAGSRVARMEANSRELLKQAARDMLLSLRREITGMLDKIILGSLQDALRPEELARIIAGLVKDCARQAEGEIVISLKKEDLQRLEEGYLAALKQKAGRGVVLREADDIQAGFSISFDAGKSQYDFSDRALAAYLGGCLKPKIKALLEEAGA